MGAFVAVYEGKVIAVNMNRGPIEESCQEFATEHGMRCEFHVSVWMDGEKIHEFDFVCEKMKIEETDPVAKAGLMELASEIEYTEKLGPGFYKTNEGYWHKMKNQDQCGPFRSLQQAEDHYAWYCTSYEETNH